MINVMNSPQDLLEFFKGFQHRDIKKLNDAQYHRIADEYIKYFTVPSFTLMPAEYVMNTKTAACYDLSFASVVFLKQMGLEAEIIHFSWKPKDNATGLERMLCFESGCLYYGKDGIYIIQWFIGAFEPGILGIYQNYDDIIKMLMNKREILFFDRWLANDTLDGTKVIRMYSEKKHDMISVYEI